MIPVPVILAHGDLGYPDELLYASFIIIFIGFLALLWYQSRHRPPKETPDESSMANADSES